MGIVFDYKAYRNLIKNFGTRVPQLLTEHSSTSDLARNIDAMDIMSTLESRFTVAIVGQMRSGKSTLLNAFLGRDLAPVGVNETTATINWFRYAEGEMEKKFRVHWRNGSTDDYPLTEVNKWLGAEEHAKNTKKLDFFSKTSFLKNVNLVDTPGTRSVLDSHEGATRGFLLDEAADRSEAQTIEQGGKSDAVIYVLNPVARATDKELLRMFGDKTRLPGATAYNSIAVIQKWELPGLNDEDYDCNPLDYIEYKTEKIRQQLKGKVADVIYVSGWLATTVRKYPDMVWVDLAKMGKFFDLDELYDEETFKEEVLDPDLPGHLPKLKNRKYLYANLGYELMKMIFWVADKFKILDGKKLRRKMWEISNIDALKNILTKRFFAQASLIKANTVLRKAWSPCTVGIGRLRDLEERRATNYTQGLSSLEAMEDVHSAQKHLIESYIRDSLKAVRDDLQGIKKIRLELEDLREEAYSNFEVLEKDLSLMEALGTEDAANLSPDQKNEIRALLGLNGTEIWKRLGYPQDPDDRYDLIGRAEDMLDMWEGENKRGIPHRRIAVHACDRLNQMLDALEG